MMKVTLEERLIIIGFRAGRAAKEGGYKVTDVERVAESINSEDLPEGMSALFLATEMAREAQPFAEMMIDALNEGF